MKSKNYLFLGVFLILSVFTSYAQCEVKTNNDTTIVCGSSVQLNSVPNATPDSVLWSPSLGLSATNIANPIATPATTTTYVVTTYTGVCVAKDTVVITLTPLQIEAGADKNYVCGGSVKLDSVTSNYTGVGPLTYSWNPTTGLSNATIANPTASVSQTTKYYVTVTSPNNCTAIDSITVTVNPLTIDAGADKNYVCGSSTKLDSVISNYTGTGMLTYAWSPSTGLNDTTIANPTTSVKQTTKYYVTVSLTGCVAMDSVTVNVNALSADAGINKILTCGGSVQLDSVKTNYTGSGTLTYSWNPSVNLNNGTIANPVASPTQTKTYYVTVYSPNSCSAMDSVLVMVNPMLIEAGTDKNLTCGGSVQLDSVISTYSGTGSLSYSWNPSVGLDNDTIARPKATITQTKKYYVTVTTPNGCTAIDSVTVNVDPLKVEAGNDKTIVCGSSAQLDNTTTNYTGTGSLIYSWSPTGGLSAANISNPVATVKESTMYYVTVTTPNRCQSFDSVKVIVDPFKINAGGDKIVSCGNSVQLDYINSNYSGTGSLSYAWFPVTGLNSTTIPNPTSTVKVLTTYVATVTTPNGCVSKDTVTVYVGPLTVDAGSNKDIVCGEGIQLGITTNYNGTGLTYAWTPSTGLSLSNIANPVASPMQTTTYYVNITTPSGCTAKDSIKITAHVFEANAGTDKTLVCGGEAQLEVTTNYSGIGALSYAWKPSAGLNLSNIPNPKASVSQKTSFSVIVTTPNGCKAYDTVDVLVGTLKAVAGPDKTITCGGTGQLEVTSNYTGTDALSYAWTPQSGLNFSNIANPIVNVAQNTTFIVKVQSLNGCIAYDTINVIVIPLSVNVGLDKIITCGKSVQLDSAITNYTGNGTLTYYWAPAKGLNRTDIPNPTTTLGNTTYTLSVFTPFGACKATDQVEVDYVPLSGTDICIVGLDSLNKNLVVWPKPTEGAIDSFLVYRETAVVGTFAKIGSVSKNAATMYSDAGSQPEVKSARYKISMKDSCGVETSLSAPHKTMYLTVKKGTGTDFNLTWEKYEGVTVSSYIIYRGTSKTNLQMIGSTAGANDTYTDIGAPSGTLYYQVEITSAASCNSSKPMKISRSNIASTSPIGIYEYENNFIFSIYPNPANESLNINVDLTNSKNIMMNIYNSLGALVKSTSIEQQTQQINVSDLNTGFYIVELRSSKGFSKQKLTIQK